MPTQPMDLFNPRNFPVRLFDIKRRKFTTKIDYHTKYAILSHRWGENELSFESLSALSRSPTTSQRLTSNQKFNGFCQVALEKYDCRYVWMDSACIDQKNNQELDDSIRCMYPWYKNAHVCIVFLSDTSSIDDLPNSSWFTRGWTLQEYLAPTRMVFFYQDWTRASPADFDILRDPFAEGNAGGKQGRLLRKLVAEATGISDRRFLHVSYEPSPNNLELVLRWAKGRLTSLPEDKAYSLISLLQVCLPPNYGEGRNKAMNRLKKACSAPSTPEKGQEAAYLTVLTRDKSKLCRRHQSIGGKPIIVRVLGTSIDWEREEDGEPMRYLLYTATPMPMNDAMVNEQFFVTEHKGKCEDNQVPLLLFREWTREVVPSIFEKCRKCQHALRHL